MSIAICINLHYLLLDPDTNDDLVNMATKTDKMFQRFRTRIKDYPDQVGWFFEN